MGGRPAALTAGLPASPAPSRVPSIIVEHPYLVPKQRNNRI